MGTSINASSKHLNLLSPQLPTQPGTFIDWKETDDCALPLAISQAAQQHLGLLLLVVADMTEALRYYDELSLFCSGIELPVMLFPDWETLPYDTVSPLPDIISQRQEALYRLPNTQSGIMIAPINALMTRLAPRSFLEANTLLLDVGEKLDIDQMRQRLERSGYYCVSQVMSHGEFAVRGSILDLFPMGSKTPFRIDLFDDEIETIRTFHPDTQRTVKQVDAIRLLPAREFPFDDLAVARFTAAHSEHFGSQGCHSVILKDVQSGISPSGIEYYLPLFFETTSTLFDYLPDNTLICQPYQLSEQVNEQWQVLESRYASHSDNHNRPVLPPQMLNLRDNEINQRIKPFPRIRRVVEQSKSLFHFPCSPLPALALDSHQDDPAQQLHQFLNSHQGRVLFVAESAGRRELLIQQLAQHKIHTTPVEHFQPFLSSDTAIGIIVGRVERGLLAEQPALAIISETLLLGERAKQTRRQRKTTEDSDAVVRNLAELNVGDAVVHKKQGIGRYLGLQKLSAGGVESEYLMLEYLNNDKVYVPVSSLELIHRYTGSSPESAPLHKLGGTQWKKIRDKVSKKIHDVAAALLEIYAKREAAVGFRYPLDEKQYAAFADEFPFEETPDQAGAIVSVIKDMMSSQPMDRLVCGDVGFGKTEVAMRAAFVSAMANKQVCVLVPTTLLARQHFQSFTDRFAQWPVKIAQLSRFVTTKDQNQTLKELTDGQVDIVIGTHKLLSKNIKFDRLGLVIIDEEQRFGVTQKERMKQLRSEVDMLSLTATPIPRTLNMALSGLRDLSIIATPPPKRYSIRTTVCEWDDEQIKEAAERELRRGGQVYFLHNRVETINEIAEKLTKLLPQVRIGIAHGQMHERELESTMLDFYHRRFNLLLATTIIESGIDIPNANTIIINQADKLGLSQLHQLRGRVGRSHHRAYAYLLTPNEKVLKGDAIKRLEAIKASEELGSGYTLATHDLEIRGAGELLGDEQSGQITDIGYTLYTDLLTRAVENLKQGKELNLGVPDPTFEIDLQTSSLITEDYLPDVHLRLVMYKRISTAETKAQLRELQIELIDRFGLLPEPTTILFATAELSLLARAMQLQSVKVGPKGGLIGFGDDVKIDMGKLILQIQAHSEDYQLNPAKGLYILKAIDNPAVRIEWLTELLKSLQ